MYKPILPQLESVTTVTTQSDVVVTAKQADLPEVGGPSVTTVTTVTTINNINNNSMCVCDKATEHTHTHTSETGMSLRKVVTPGDSGDFGLPTGEKKAETTVTTTGDSSGDRNGDRRQLIERTRQLDIRQLVATLAPLAAQSSAQERVDTQEVARPCPKCGGEDRFHVTQSWWFCRQCHPKRGDQIDLVRWLKGGIKACSMDEALAVLVPFLENSDMAIGPTVSAPSPTPLFSARSQGRSGATANSCHSYRNLNDIEQEAYHHLMQTAYGVRGREYLSSRCISLESRKIFRLGYYPDAPVPNSGGLRRGAIVIPWFAPNGHVMALRYRFIEDFIKPKKALHPRSTIAGCVYWCVHPIDTPLSDRTLYLVEGELNAISIFQQGFDAVSLGSESASIPPNLVDNANRFRSLVVWYDRPELARNIALQFAKAKAVSSTALGGDANALLQTGKLLSVLAANDNSKLAFTG